MAKKNKPTKATKSTADQNNGENVGTAVSKTEQFFTKYDTLITWIMVGIIVVVFGVYAINKWVMKPQREEAAAQSFVAERYFRQDNFDAALNGDGNNLGFLDIIKHYGDKGGSDVYFYTGICEMQKGNYQDAIKYLRNTRATILSQLLAHSATWATAMPTSATIPSH